MSKRVIWISGIFLFCCLLFSIMYVALFCAPRIAYVDSEKLISSYKGMKAAQDAYQKKVANVKSNTDTLAMEIEQVIADLNSKRSRISKSELSLSEELIRTKRQQLQQYQQAMQSQLQLDESKLNQEVILKINLYLKKYGQEHRYQFILAATAYGNLAYADSTKDITEIVLTGLNSEFDGK